MVGPAGRHGCSPAVGEWQDLLLPGWQLLEVQRPVSPPRPLLFHISRRFMVDSGSPPFPRDAQDWLFDCYESNQDEVGDSFSDFFKGNVSKRETLVFRSEKLRSNLSLREPSRPIHSW